MPNLQQAMSGPNKDGYWEACKKELSMLKDGMGMWDIMDREAWMKVLPSTWAHCCKQYLDGAVRAASGKTFSQHGTSQSKDCFDIYSVAPRLLR
jgi:hypothetical protein